MEVGVKIKEYLEEKGITQTFISRKTGIELPKLNLALNGKRRITLEEYSLICGVLKLNTDFFLKPRLPDETKNC
ncbi:XRE family transcriptional regulator [Eubacterium sp. AF15-50]|uniref:helix-turn-helix domain-containing protein n=1 Tax=unclassified Eubacterium (in: firmicutes) TaxID=2624479 RepID=UPI000E550DE5|nr:MULTISPECIES: helix-turn-helix transcriptional regulator [unclassified Eubacterium (in: firmicutes)]RHR72596.1 XRE family transcriptional regulator [Eubacterium sp. AF16-48]RHR77846.1 XRE family transcriptional regulator [Eubacterium sp. AF15-50]